nr:unnamed protein product [Spirometra erinaceieuropaei]
MGEIGTNLLRRRIAEQAREQSAIRDAALENKFRKLPNPTSPRNDKQVHNLSSKELTKDQMQVLRHEASFNTADAKPVNMIAAVESILCQTEATEEPKILIRHQVPSLLMAHRPREVLSKVERDALRELKADKDLVIVPADKGRATVVLDRTDYLQKAKGLLEDRQFYVPCATNPLKALTREINATLLALENSGAITPTDRRMARPQDTALARFYGLPKVHKDGAPLRPIVSLKGTPTYRLAKWLFRRLKFLTAESDTTVSSSAQFLEKLKGDLAIETIELLLQSKYDETENRLGHAQILELLKLCLRTYFTFDGTIYEQVKGTPMCSPISGFIAEAVLQRLESLVFQHHRPKFWARYVDDTFAVIERDQVLTFQEHLNAVFPDIQFTMEEEENNQLAFLDVLVCRKDCGGLKTKVFRKATNTMQCYQQLKGAPMGSPISGFLAEVTMQKLETTALPSIKPKLWLRYVDDTFVIVKKDQLEALHNNINATIPGITFTLEKEVDSKLPFLDVLVQRKTDGTLPCDAVYCGQTGKRASTRIHEHQLAVKRRDHLSQVAMHTLDTGHTFAWEKTRIVAVCPAKKGREFLEAMHSDDSCINRHIELDAAYSNLKERWKRRGPIRTD